MSARSPRGEIVPPPGAALPPRTVVETAGSVGSALGRSGALSKKTTGGRQTSSVDPSLWDEDLVGTDNDGLAEAVVTSPARIARPPVPEQKAPTTLGELSEMLQEDARDITDDLDEAMPVESNPIMKPRMVKPMSGSAMAATVLRGMRI